MYPHPQARIGPLEIVAQGTTTRAWGPAHAMSWAPRTPPAAQADLRDPTPHPPHSGVWWLSDRSLL